MSLSIYHYVVLLMVFLLIRLLFRWIIALCFQLRFGQIGFFSVSSIRYCQSIKDDTNPTEKFTLSVGKLKLRIKRPTSSLSTAWITIHIEQVELCVLNLRAMLDSSSSAKNGSTATRPSTSTLSRRISQMGTLPHIPWWYSISIVKHIVKFTSALPAQFLMAGLANYVDVQLDGLQVIVEQTNVLKIDTINLSSILFAAMVQPTLPTETNNSNNTTTTSAPSVSTETDSPHQFLNAGHQRHSLKRAQHLFKEKFFEIILQLGPISIGDQGLLLPQGGRIAISCHLSAGCLTLKDVDTSLHVDALSIQLDKLIKLRTLLQQPHHYQHHQHHHSSDTRRGKKKQQLVEIIHSMAISVSHIQVVKNYNDGYSLGVDIDYINAMTTMSPRKSGSKSLGSLCKLQMEMGHIDCLINKATRTKESSRLVTFPEVCLTGSIPMVQHDLNNLEISDISDGPNQQVVQANLTITDCIMRMDQTKVNLLEHLLASSKTHQATSPTLSSSYDLSPHEFMQKRLPKCSLVLKLESPRLEFIVHDPDRGYSNEIYSLGIIQWSTILLDTSGEYVLQSQAKSPLLSMDKQQQQEEQQQHSTDASSALRNRKKNGLRWTRLFRNSWRFRQPEDGNDGRKQTNWVYNATARVAIHDMEITVKKGNTMASSPVLSIQAVEGAIGTCMPTLNTADGFVMVVCTVSSERNEVDININCPSLYPCVTVPGGDSSLLALELWKGIIHQLQHLQQPKSKPSQPTLGAAKKINLLMENWLKWFRINVVMSHLKLVGEGLDKKLHGEREVPQGYIDNSPKQDVYVTVAAMIERFSICYHGALHKSEHSMMAAESTSLGNRGLGDSEVNTDGMLSKSSLQVTVQTVRIVRLFGTHRLGNSNLNDLVFWMPRLTATLSIGCGDDKCVFSLTTVMKYCGLHFSVANHYALLLVLHSLKGIKNKLKLTKVTTHGQQESTKLAWWALEKVRFQLNRADTRITLPQNVELFLRLDGLRLEKIGLGQPLVNVRNATLFGVAVNDDSKWDQLLEIDNLQYTLQRNNMGQKVNQLSMVKLFVRVPYRYVIADLVDNGVNLIKYFKAINPRLSGAKPFTYFGPTLKNDPMLVPRINICCNRLVVHFEDDPFEARLRLIWRTGLMEQKSRLDVLDAFEVKARTEGEERVFQARQRLNEHNSNTWMKHINAAMQQEILVFDELRNQDYRSNSDGLCTSPLSQQQRYSGQDADDDHHAHLNSAATRLFDIDVIDLPRHFPLLDFTIRSTVLNIRPPDFPLDQTRKFVHDTGKGVPLDTDFTTLAPFHLDWHGGETWAQLRDYPVPFMHVSGESRYDEVQDGDNTQTKAWTLSGDYVFGDQAGDLESTRVIEVPILDNNGIYYTMDAVRVASPPKFYSIVNIDVHTPKLTSICWCVPYQPAIQDLSRAMDTFTRPPVDPSSKVGIWDKIRLMIHTQATISFVGGGDLALVLKGSRDPYDLTDRGFGLAKLWKKNVVWLIGHNNSQGEFMQVLSQDLLFGVPDLVNGGYRVPHLLFQPEEYSDGLLGDSNNQQTLDSTATTLKENDDESLLSDDGDGVNGKPKNEFLKVALRFTGGIRMGLGCHLERLCVGDCTDCDGKKERCRHLHFRPHYLVKYKAPHVVENMPDHGKGYDAFAGFRSDFIHLSLSIIKLSEKEYTQSPLCNFKLDTDSSLVNALYLSPGFLDHFLSTCRLFGGNMSYPLRTGSLYPRIDMRTPKKLGAHMKSMKYKVVVNPLRLGYFYKDDRLVNDSNTSMTGHGDTVGLKGHVKTFSIDIHQQREQAKVETIDERKKSNNMKRSSKPGWQINEAEVELRNIDLRVVRASYHSTHLHQDNPSHTNDMTNGFCSEEETDPDFMDGTDRRADENEVDSTWLDMEDFVEMNVVTPDIIPKVQVLPFAFSPCMYYIKQSNPDDVEKYRYLRGTHDCIIGTAADTREMQLSLLEERRQNIEIQIRKHQTRLNNVERKLAVKPDDKELLKESKTIVKKTEILFEKRNLLQRYLRDLSKDAMPGCTHDSTTKTTAHSDSTIFGEDSISRWEEKMGHFKVRYTVHNPQIIWNNSVRNIVFHFMDLQAHKRALSYYMSTRAVKFLRDLTKKHQKQRRYKTGQFFVEDDEGGLDSETVQQLLDQLVSEQTTKFFAPNETELPTSTGGSDGDHVNMSNNDNVKSPDRQLASIPAGYSMKSSYLIDLLNPQISLQSDCDPDNLVLMSNERIQAKAFNITEDKEMDLEMQLVKNRTIVSLDNTQFFVAKKEQFDTVDLLLDNHYGAKGHEHWLTWIPSEMLIDYVKRSDKFQRVGTQLSPTIQIDRHNGLRLKTHSALFTRYLPFEERCDSVHLNFPNLALTADSAQYNAIYEVVVDLLLYKEPAKKERLERLHEIMMAADQGSLYDATENIVELQHRVRHCMGLRDQYQQNITLLDQSQLEEFRKIRLTLQDTCEDLYLGMEAFKLLQTNVRNDRSHEPSSNWKFIFSAAKLSWEMRIDSETPFCEWNLNNTTFTLVSKEDHSHTNTVEVDLLQVKNTSDNHVYTEVLSPFVDQRNKLPDFSRHKMLRCYLEALAPVGGIPVIQHLEINLFPLRCQMTYDFGKTMASYLFPAERRQKDNQQQQQQQVSSSAKLTSNNNITSSPIVGSPNNASFPTNGSVGGGSDTNSISSDALHKSASANLEIKDKDSMKNDSGYPRSATTDNLQSTSIVSEIPTTPTSNSGTTPTKEVAETTDANGDGSSVALLNPPTPPHAKSSKRNKNKEAHLSDDLSVMKKRASGNRTFILVKIPGTKHCLTYKGPKEKNIEDLREFAFQQPYLEYRNKTWSWFELLSNIKRDFMRAALVHNSRALLKEKLTIRRHPRNDTLTSSGSIAESNFFAAMIPTVAEISPRQITYEWEDGSGDSDSDDMDNNKDDTSLHSATSHEIDLDPFMDQKQSSTAASTHSLSWTHKFKRKIAIKPEVPEHIQPSFSMIEASVNNKKNKQEVSTLDELTTKGRLLLGKHYHGPTMLASPSQTGLHPNYHHHQQQHNHHHQKKNTPSISSKSGRSI
ncbi:golgi-body localization protein domain-containing protein [Chlamydoabsidia padenii]|nr:golgi-body localization protein domain-containing protein [Chlamydoabsidia padenii]